MYVSVVNCLAGRFSTIHSNVEAADRRIFLHYLGS